MNLPRGEEWPPGTRVSIHSYTDMSSRAVPVGVVWFQKTSPASERSRRSAW